MNKKVFIIGANGLIGGALHRVFSKKPYAVFGGDKEAAKNDFTFVDITEKNALKQEIRRVNPDILVLTAALSHVDYCEEFPQESEDVNIQGLQNVLDAMDRERMRLIFFSSDYIFDGMDGPYGEEDKPNPLSVYGRHKLRGEELIKASIPHHLIIRTTGVYGPEAKGKNFVLSLAKRLRAGEKVRVPFDQIGSPTYSENLAEVIEELTRTEKTGTYNIAGPERIDRFSFARKICRVFSLPEDMLIPVYTKDLGQKAARPLRGGLKLEKIQGEISIPLLDTAQGLLEMKRVITL